MVFRKLGQLLLVITLSWIASIHANAQYDHTQQKETLFLSVNKLLQKSSVSSFDSICLCTNVDTIQLFYTNLTNEYQLKKSYLNENQIIVFNISLGILEKKLNKVDKCLESFNNALRTIHNKNDKPWVLLLKFEQANIYRNKGNYKKSNELFYELVNHSLFDSTGYSRSDFLTVIAQNHEYLNEYVEALEILLNLKDENIKETKLAEASYNLVQMGRVASHLEVDTFYFEYFHRAVEMAFQSEDKGRISNNLVNLGRTYLEEGYFQKALSYLSKAKEYNKYSKEYSQGYYFSNLSLIYLKLDSLDKSIIAAKACLDKANIINANFLKYQAYDYISQCFEKKGYPDSALFYLQKSFTCHKLTDRPYQYSSYKQLSNLSIKKGDYKLALSYLDSSFNEYEAYVKKDNTEKLAQLREKSDYYIHRSRISDLVISNQKEKQKSRTFIIVITSALLLLAATFIFIVFYRKRHKQLKDAYINLVSKNIELDKTNKKLNVLELTSRPKKDKIKDEDHIIERLEVLMVKDELFTNHTLSLSTLAKKLHTNTSYLSSVINSHYSYNLRTLINKYRICKAKEMLINKMYSNYCIEGISNEIGFNSRSSFYQAFKKETGLNPILYIENYKIIDANKES